ncbi:hypothetical protein CF15_00095 [Pyrodictium occultum]|uniref:DUF2299 domain-containing protein n=1 Tax=Pyrodictium occultum TaxID=2309 RepID=A0A0V8RTB2_PYROC|nr:DUF2299 family protein [Pyrodictium occultum]KSW11311.1 hypothetical protein CF15_00095 [Pyrodictium occultum]
MAKQAREKITAWLTDAGLVVAPLNAPMPSNAEWGLLVATPPPLQVKLRVIGLKNGDVILSIGVNFSEQHREEVRKMPVEERVRFTAQLLERLIAVCPYCRVALNGSIDSPEAIVAEVLLSGDEVSRQRIMDGVARLVNLFLMVNAVLWERFPGTVAGKEPQSQSFI